MESEVWFDRLGEAGGSRSGQAGPLLPRVMDAAKGLETRVETARKGGSQEDPGSGQAS